MAARQLDSGQPAARTPWPRKSARVALDADVTLRRPGHIKFRVKVHNASRHGCKIEFVDCPRLDDRIWIKFDGLECLEAVVCWIDGHVGGVEFEKPIHPAVFEAIFQSTDVAPRRSQ